MGWGHSPKGELQRKEGLQKQYLTIDQHPKEGKTQIRRGRKKTGVQGVSKRGKKKRLTA